MAEVYLGYLLSSNLALNGWSVPFYWTEGPPQGVLTVSSRPSLKEGLDVQSEITSKKQSCAATPSLMTLLAVTIVAFMVLAGGGLQTAVAQGDGPGGGAIAELTIAGIGCPAGFVVADKDPIGSATANCSTPQVGVDFSVRLRAFEAQPTILTTGESGLAVAGLSASDLGYDVQITLPSGALGYVVNCTRTDGGDPGVAYTSAGFQLVSAATTGDEIGCDVFFVFAGDVNETPDPSASDDSEPVPSADSSDTSEPVGTSANPSASVSMGTGTISLPNTGSGSTGTSSTSFLTLLAIAAGGLIALGGFSMSRRRH